MDIHTCHEKLKGAGVVFSAGLSAVEFAIIEGRYRFQFPPDLRAFLANGLPTSQDWVDWRNTKPADIERWLNLPYDDICFDIEHNVFWHESWGAKPKALDECYEIAKRAINAAPKLIPICGHRFIPEQPREAGNPIFSVHQTDIIYYGCDLYEFFENEFRLPSGREYRIRQPVKRIEFWTDMVERNQ